ncbi:hypothetical protein DRW03_19465 [Corallococcus sp. H22C18031201]|nr:hypothetical protein DRW03_19465 [Corallococcus sp. H22C18031201]
MTERRTEILQAVRSGALTPEEALRRLRDVEPPRPAADVPLTAWRPQWRVTGPLPSVGTRGALSDVLILDRDERFRALCADLPGADRTSPPVLCMQGEGFTRLDARTYRIDPRRAEDFPRLVEALQQDGHHPSRIVSLWGASASSRPSLDSALEEGFDTVVHLLQALHLRRMGDVVRFLCVHPEDGGASVAAHAALAGLGHSLWLENPLRTVRTVECSGAMDAWRSPAFASALLAEPAGPPGRVLYAEGQRWIRGWDEGQRVERGRASAPARWRDRGVYLITGGLGGLGRILAEHLARTCRARLLITGRRAPSAAEEASLDALRRYGAEALYVSADVTRAESLAELIATGQRRFGPLNGVFHGAGVAPRTGILLEKSLSSMRSVLAPKVHGAALLDDATRSEPLDFFVLLSSLSSQGLGEGVGEYAFANRFLDELAEQRNARVRRGEGGSGDTVSVGWPYWREGGMRQREATVEDMREQAGVEPLSTEDGLTLLDWALENAPGGCLPIAGDRTRFAEYLARFDSPRAPTDSPAPDPHPEPRAQWRERIEALLLQVAAELTGLPREELELERRLPEYGLNSIALTTFVKRLSETLGALPRNLLLEYQTLAALRDHLLEHHAGALTQAFAPSRDVSARAVAREPVVTVPMPPVLPAPLRAVAVVGVSGRYAGARDVRELLANLRAGRRGISAVPPERGDWSRWFDANPARAGEGRIYRRTGGFISGVELFDPLAFQMTPAEAKGLHPEERLLLQSAWEAIEDAGHAHTSVAGTRMGVFIGVNGLSYPLLGLERWAERGDVLLDQSYFGLPNRISHFLDLRGPSVPFDTGCSSALVALDAACRAMAQGECDGALVGGVNLYLHVSRFATLCQARLASTREAPGLFERGNDGFVPGEGVGVVWLKPLDVALRDGDPIYGVIRSTVVGHKGRSASFLLPSPPAQSELMERALKAAQVSPEEIGYVELQAVGAELTDLSEWRSVTEVLGRASDDTRCALGSVKPLLGHLEAASGMAQLTRVLLQLDRAEWFPTPMATELHDGISVDPARFHIPTRLEPWPTGRPRRALLGSAAAGGTQAFVVVESSARTPPPRLAPRDELLVLSGRSSEQLQRTAAALRTHVLSEDGGAVRLADLAYVLQVGREPGAHRFAARITDREQLLSLLDGVARLGMSAPGGVGGVVDSKRSRAQLSESAAVAIYGERELSVAARQWVEGAQIEWRRVPGADLCRRISLPTHAFEQRRCWRDEPGARVEEPPSGVVSGYYNRFAAEVDPKEEIYLIFPYFPEKLPGFSWLMTFVEPHRRPEHARYMLERQKDMKAVLYRHVDFSRVRTVMDIGCGLATDLIQLALRHPHLTADGFTIAKKQVDAASARISKAGLADRLRIECKDSSRDAFPRRYDLILGFEVIFHIENKDGVFANIAEHLNEGGWVVLADGVANTVTEINLPHLGQFTSTAPQLAELLGRHGLRVVSCVDTSPGVSRFLDDEHLEENLARLRTEQGATAPEEAQHRGWANFGKALGAGLIRYLLFTLQKAPASEDRAERVRLNLERIVQAHPFTTALGSLPSPAQAASRVVPAREEGIEQQLLQVASDIFEMASTELDATASFKDYGIGSLTGLRFIDAVNRRLQLRLKMEHFFQCPDLRALAAFIQTHDALRGTPELAQSLPPVEARATVRNESPGRVEVRDEPIAVIGMAGRFPGAEDVARLWENLRDGVDSVTEFPVARLVSEGWDADAARAQARGCWGGFIDGIEDFEPTFFGISPAEAEMMDPQQRLFLEQCWVTLEGAGYAGKNLWGSRCGVIAGLSSNEYQDKVHGELSPDQLGHAMLGNFASLTASRIAYFLNLRGPTVTVDTACSSSLVAVHLACRSLLDGEADLMLAGGVSLYLSPKPLGVMRHVGMLSPSGRCRAFSDDADGIAIGEGVGVVLLKRLSRALADGDVIHGVIRGSGTNQDGRTNGITAPSLDAQKQLEIDVYERSGVNPETLGYVECHGTGTKLGDPIEIAALSEAFRHFTRARQSCAVGSVKSNLGHTTAAAGVAGLIKLLLSLEHRQLPPTLHVQKENRHIAFKNTPFYVNTALKDWDPRAGQPRRAAVSAFGFSGANCHVVVEEAPVRPPEAASGSTSWVVPVSAPTPERLREHVARLQGALSSSDAPTRAIGDLAFTLQVGRREFPHRVAVVAASLEEVLAAWSSFLAGRTHSGLHVAEARPGAPPLGREAVSSQALADAWVGGADVTWAVPRGARRVRLPGTPFVRRRCWVTRPPPDQGLRVSGSHLPSDVAVGARPVRYRPTWVSVAPRLRPESGRASVLLFEVEGALRDRFIEAWHARGHTGAVIAVSRSEVFTSIRSGGDLRCGLDATRPQHLESYARLVEEEGLWPEGVVLGDEGREPSALVPVLQWLLRAGAKHPRRVVLVSSRGQGTQPLWEARAGFAPSLRHVVSETHVTTLTLPVDCVMDVAAGALLDEVTGQDSRAHEVRLLGRERQVRTFLPCETVRRAETPVRRGGIYLITGGSGALGRLVARHWAEHQGVSLVLVGRRSPDAAFEAELLRLRKFGGRVRYVQADVCDSKALRHVVEETEAAWGRLNGVVHAAGAIDAAPFLARDAASFTEGLKPKIEGVQALDAATRGCALDFFVLFSSVSSILGDWGGCDYAVANRYLDAFAQQREEQRARGERAGRTVSINWPLWRHGGMHLAPDAEALYLRTSGLSYLEDAPGLEALELALRGEDPQVVVLAGQQERLDRLMSFVEAPPEQPRVAAPVKPNRPVASLRDELRREAAAILGLRPDELTFEGQLGDFGFDSISLRALAGRLAARFGVSVATATFYAHPTLDALAVHLTPQCSVPAAPVAPVEARQGSSLEPIAVVGMSGSFPGAQDVETFWQSLSRGEAKLTRARLDRYDAEAGGAESAVEHWGGFLDGVDQFDADFFRVSPREAELMDPQQRLLLQALWNTFEDAGITPERLRRGRTGVFVGVDKFDYAERWQQSREPIDPHSAAGIHPAMIANRISFVFDLQGPSEVVNTGCSSAAVALHRAMGAIRQGECDSAVVGGVNVMLSPSGFLAAQSLGGTSPGGQPRPFDANADGSVRGEAVGAVLLKRLSQANADGDRIHGVLLGSAAAHGGRGHSLTSPNVLAQAEVVAQAYRQAGVGAETVRYIEAQGAANELGDAVELAAFKTAFQRMSPNSAEGTCAIGCLKGSVGHAEGASAVTALIKVLLAFRHELLPGVTGFQVPRPGLGLEGSPFFINAGNRSWAADPSAGPRRASLHSYGFGGVCAHLVLEAPPATPRESPARPDSPRLIVLSARDAERLDVRLRELVTFLEREPTEGRPSLTEVSFTLLDGRTPLEARVAVVAASVEELTAQLRQVLGGGSPPGVFRGRASHQDGALAGLFDGESGAEMVRMLMRAGDLSKLARAWVEGASLDARVLFAGERPRRVGLPTYPFRRARHWLRTHPVEPARSVEARPAPKPTHESAPAATSVIAQLQRMLSELLKRDSLDVDRPMVEYGLDSFLSTTFMRAVQRHYGAAVALTAPLAHPTLRALATHLSALVGSAPAPSLALPPIRPAPEASRASGRSPCPELLSVNPRGTATPSFWFHGAPGLAQLYYRLSESLGPDYPFYALQARGVDGRSAPITTLPGMISHYLDAIREVQPHGPYVLGGYSFGGLLAFEAAQQLKARGHEVRHLVMFDTYPPEMLDVIERGGGATSGSVREMQRLLNAMMFFSAELDTPVWDFISLEELKAIPPGAQLAHLAGLIKQRVRTALTLDEVYSFLSGVDSVVGISESITRSYRLAAYDASDVLYFKTARFLAPDSEFVIPNVVPEDVGVSRDTLRALEAHDYTAAWRGVTQRSFKLVNFDCDHMSLFLKPTLDEVCGHLRTVLAPGA